MILFFDTETSGKADFKAHYTAAHQPHLVQLAAILTDEDLVIRHRFSAIVRPNGWTIPDDAAAVHGITTEIASRWGFQLNEVLHQFMGFCFKANQRVAHNLSFDDLVMDTAFHRIGDGWDREFSGFCTMQAMTDVCQLPGPYGYKWPKLTEAFQHATGRKMEGAHDAMGDVLGCLEVYRWLVTNGKIPKSEEKAVAP